MSTENTSLAAMLAQYDKNASSSNTSTKFDLKNYFSTFLDKKENTAVRTIRILPTLDGSSPFVEMHGHKIQVEGEWKTFACLQTEKDGAACPFCEAYEELRATGKDSDKEIAKKYGSRRMYIVKVIDRDKEEEGIKFWRFNHDYRKTGTFDKIIAVAKLVKGDITDPIEGRDLQITLARDQNKKTVIQSILPTDKCVLTSDAEQLEAWTSDESTWHEVYAIKTYDYLSIIVNGEVPVYDKVNKKYVAKSSINEEGDGVEAETTMGGIENVKKNIQTATTSVASAKAEEADEDDLPF